MNLSDRMKSEAVGLGLCSEWTAGWEDKSSKDAMVEKFVRGIDFCIQHDWPSCEAIKRDFGDVIHEHGVYVDEACHITNSPVVVLNGSCDASGIYDGHTVATIYVRHKSKLRLLVGGMAKVRVCLYDESEVSVSVKGYAKCSVYRYGGSVKSNDGARVLDRREWAKENLHRNV